MNDIFHDEESCELCQSYKKMTSHNIKMYLLILGAAVIGGLTYMQQIGSGGSAVSSLLSILAFAEHLYGGNTGTPTA